MAVSALIPLGLDPAAIAHPLERINRVFKAACRPSVASPQSPPSSTRKLQDRAPFQDDGFKRRLDDELSIRSVLANLSLEEGQTISTALVANYIVDLDVLKRVLEKARAA